VITISRRRFLELSAGASALTALETCHPMLVLQLYFVRMQEKQQRSGPEGPSHSLYFRVLKHPAPSGIFDLQL
jgi:hypothetical protein